VSNVAEPSAHRQTSSRRIVLAAGLAAALLAPLWALAAGAVWLAVRALTYAASDVIEADILEWRLQHDPHRAAETSASPILRFADHAGTARQFASSHVVYLDRHVAGPELLPAGPFRVRYRRWPFFAEVDDKGLWFTLPSLWIALAVFGAMLHWFFRTPVLRWLGW
jgi:hypothetical protein